MNEANEIICPTCQTANSPERQDCFVCGESLTSEDVKPSKSSPVTESPAPGRSDENLEETWLDDLTQLGQEERVPIDQAWPSPDWLDEEEEPEDPANDLLNWLREEESTEPEPAGDQGEVMEDEQPDDSLDGGVDESEDYAVDDIVEETAAPDWLDEIKRDVVSDETPIETEPEIEATGEVTEADFPEWLADLALDDEWSELGDQGTVTEDLGEEAQDQAFSLPLDDYRDPTDDLSNVPDRLAKQTLPSWLSSQFPDLGADQFDAEEQKPDQPEEDVAVDRIRLDEKTWADDLESREGLELGEEQVSADSSGDMEDGSEPLNGQEQVRRSESLDGTVDDRLEARLEEELDWFLDEGELVDQTPLSPLIEEEALLADLHEKGVDDNVSPPEQVQEFIEASEVEIDPAWLSSLTTLESEHADWENREEDSGPLSGLRGVLDRPQAVVFEELSDPIRADGLTNEIVRRTALLERLTEGKPLPGRLQGALDKSSTTSWPRAILALILILLLLVGWLAPFTDFDTSSANSASDVGSVIDNAAGKTVLMAFDYTPAWGGELDLAAEALLTDLADSGFKVLTASQSPAGVGMANLAIERIEGIDHFSLGFLPGEAVGLRNLAICLNELVQCEDNFGMALNAETQESLKNLGLIIVLAAERDELTRWIEQVGGVDDIEMVAGVTQSLAPVAKPYVTSGQLAGVIDSPASAANYLRGTNGDTSYLSERASSIALANWLSIGVLVFALLFSGVSTLANRSPQKSRVSENV